MTHETIGYSEAGGPFALPLASQADGVWRMDIATGEARLLASYARLKACHPVPSRDQAIHWVSRIEINPASSRIQFLCDMQSGERRNFGSFCATPDLGQENRCDLHPRWSRDGWLVCIDAVHEHPRPM